MQVALLSDIHGNLPALEAVVADIQTREVDWIVNLGDSLSGPLYPFETAEFLMRQNWLHLKGNHERQLLTQPIEKQGLSDAYAFHILKDVHFKWLAGLPESIDLAGKLYCCHGSVRSDTEYFLHSVTDRGEVVSATAMEVLDRLAGVNFPAVACGHTHLPAWHLALNGAMVVNPGSVGLPAYDDEHPVYHRVESNDVRASYMLIRLNEFPVGVEIVRIAYDHQSVAKRALKNSRADWASALQFGVLGKEVSL
ncbi:metallophosphatase family protein [Leeia sp. TBRC 13508]|uniref:Metallophosphatase family protein n=1 Tax=Leeia speluncae TaxID=2884804 RepID=A0ABS8D1Z5_9NEIS|nr:metallophosphoesterase family protein [Leeia speluncae]MCB6182006.1 metallophosphatase family protein [Leeia speluncae]